MLPTHAQDEGGVTDGDMQAWTGRTDTLHDDITAAPLRGWSAMLDRDDPAPRAGDAVPPLAHWLYFLPQHLQREVGPDGHPRRGGFLPPVPLPRRMWAGGRLSWELANPLSVGDVARRVSRIESVSRKSGRSGELVFVLVRHEFFNARGLALTEEHDIVYRAAPRPGDVAPPPQPAPRESAWQRELTPDEVLLFRFSALTFNGHRIHYDRAYVTQEEGYPGLVVHGPLMATLLADLARRHTSGAQMTRFDFKALRPVFDGTRLRLHGQPAPDGRSVNLWVEDHEGCMAMQATAGLDSPETT